LCALVFTAALSKAANNQVEKKIRADYEGKVLTLRKFYAGERLRFGLDGQPIGEATIGPWTVDGQLRVKRIKLTDHILQIEAQRLQLFFDPGLRQFRDVFSLAKDDKAWGLFRVPGQRQSGKELAKLPRLEVEIEVTSVHPDAGEISTAMNAIFLGQEERLADFVPDFWRAYFAKKEGRTEAPAATDERVYDKDECDIRPRVAYQPDPEYSEAARRVGYQGHIKLSLVVNNKGEPTDIQIVEPAGLGLDETSVEAVSAWKITPCQKDARPVAVRMHAETSFRLY
jgi:TonB family protein